MGYVYTVNANVANVPTGGAVPLGTAVHYEGCSCELSGNGILCKGSGNFSVDGTIALSPVDGSSAVVVGTQVVQDGQDVQGGYSAVSTTGIVTLPIHAVVRNDCCGKSNVAIENIGAAVSVNSVAVTVRKL